MLVFIRVSFRTKAGEVTGEDYITVNDWDTARFHIWQASQRAESLGLDIVWDIEDNFGETDSGGSLLLVPA
ncbi:MAG TPA: hypothetical protein VGN15_07685 [Ktedonobacteraceae bacterium]|jgi:hypothetical protein|nr:hypothetical protein [Ktedonobacteraceae bacterium]